MTMTEDVIRAAGGIVWRIGRGAPRLAVAHRPEHQDWVLPKGKLEPGESAEAAALREVREETGSDAVLGASASSRSSQATSSTSAASAPALSPVAAMVQNSTRFGRPWTS